MVLLLDAWGEAYGKDRNVDSSQGERLKIDLAPKYMGEAYGK